MIRELNSVQDPAFPALMELFHSEFPPETREPDARIREEVEERFRLPFRYWVAEDPEFAGFVCFVRLSEMAFVIHLAVIPSKRGKGLGTRLLQIVRENAGEPIIAEVEQGEPMRWWAGQGARVLTPPYTQPALRPETSPVPFNLMAIGAVADPPALVRRFYSEAFELPAHDPLVQRAVAGLNVRFHGEPEG